MDLHQTAQTLNSPEVRELARRVMTYLAPRSLWSDLGLGHRNGFRNALVWASIGAAAGAATVYFGGENGAEHRRAFVEWLRKTFPAVASGAKPSQDASSAASEVATVSASANKPRSHRTEGAHA